MTDISQLLADYGFEVDGRTWRRGLDRLERRDGGGWTLVRGYAELGHAFDALALKSLLMVFYERGP